MKKKSGDEGRLEIELDAGWTATGRGMKVIHDFPEHVCTGYTSLMRAQPSSYHDLLMIWCSPHRNVGNMMTVFASASRRMTI